MTDSGSGLLGSAAEYGDAEPEPPPTTPQAQPDGPAGRSAAFDARVEEIRRRYGSDVTFFFPRLEDLIRRRLGVAPMSAGAAVLFGSLGVALRLALALLVTGLAGQWTDIPWGRWAAILVVVGFMDATQHRRTPPLDVRPSPWQWRVMENWTALLPTIVREADLQDLADFARRWIRLPVAAVVGVAVAALILGACRLFAPTALSELPAGSIVLLALLLYDLGALMVFGELFWWALVARQARYDHHLFWASPADSPEVHMAMRKMPDQAFATGFAITAWLVLTVVLVGWDSPLVLPLAVGFVVIGYLTVFGGLLGNRASIRKIVERARHQRLAVLRHRIDGFEPRFADLSAQESARVQDLIGLHRTIRDAPATPSTTHNVVRTAAGLIVPTIAFAITVFGEVSAERLLDAILP